MHNKTFASVRAHTQQGSRAFEYKQLQYFDKAAETQSQGLFFLDMVKSG
jgi:hypothetical protein